MEKKKALYTCPYCRGEHETPGSLARCILVCEDKIKMEEEAKQKAKLAAEKNARYKEVIDAYENFEELRNKFVDDYGQFTFEHKGNHDWFWKSIGML